MKGDKCSFCNEPAIGYDFHPGAYGADVCANHAPDELLQLEPGERKKTDYGSVKKYEVE